MNNTEIWKDIVGYEGLYQVSSLGNVKSLNYNHTGKEKVLSNVINSSGYCHVSLWKDKTKKVMKVHRLVAQTFISNPDNKDSVDHINGIRSDNRLENLRWTTPKENINYPLAKSHLHQSMINNPKLSKSVYQIDKTTGEVINEYPSTQEACRQTGISFQNISKCCRGIVGFKSAGGYIWKYA